MKAQLLTLLFLAIASLNLNGQVNLANGLVAHYRFDGNVNDLSPNGLNGTLVGASYDTGHFGKPNTALNFNGSSDYVSVAHNAKLSITSDKSVSVWYKIPTATGLKIYPTLVYKQGQSDYSNYGVFFAEEAGYGANRYKIGFQQGVGTTNKTIYTKEKYTDYVNQWVNIISTYSSSDGYVRIYFNGSLSDSLYISSITSNTSTDDLQIGRGNNINYSVNYFTGLLDDIRIYDRALNTDEVAALQTDGNSLGISTPSKQSNLFEIYPNPNSGSFTISSPFNFDNEIKVTVKDILGREVYTAKIENGATIVLDNSLTKGTYMVEIISDNNIQRQKIVKE
jgi:hypothetical protein